MTEAITIEYKPITGSNLIHTRKIIVNIDELFGIIIMADALSSPDRILIKLQNGNIVDITQSNTSIYFGNNPNIFEHTAKFMNYDVSFDGLGLIQGAIQVCLMLGVDPSSVITKFKKKGIQNKIKFGRYIGMVSIPNFTEYNDGAAILLSDANVILPHTLVESLSKSVEDCFPEYPAGIIVPSKLYVITTDENRSNVIASCTATLNGPASIGRYKAVGPYIFSVCTNNEYRGQGLSKTIMISMLNDLISQGYRKFTLEVLPSNTVAYSLYQSLGFKKVATTKDDDNNIYDLLYLNIS